jgi:hypothetical protein
MWRRRAYHVVHASAVGKELKNEAVDVILKLSLEYLGISANIATNSKPKRGATFSLKIYHNCDTQPKKPSGWISNSQSVASFLVSRFLGIQSPIDEERKHKFIPQKWKMLYGVLKVFRILTSVQNSIYVFG